MDKGYLWFNVYSSYNFAEPLWPLGWCAHKSHLSFDEFSLWQSKLYTNEHLLMIQITVHKACPKNLHTVLRAAFRVSPSLHPLMPAALPEVLWGAPKVGHITQAVWYVKPFVLHLPMYMCSGDCLWFYCSNWRRNEFPVLSPFPLNGERPCVCVCVCVCVRKRDLLVNCAVKSWGSLRERHSERACHSAAKSSARVHTENVLDSWDSADTVWPSNYMFSITHSQVAFLYQIFTCALSLSISLYTSTTSHGDSQLSFLPFLSETFMIFLTFAPSLANTIVTMKWCLSPAGQEYVLYIPSKIPNRK